MTWGAVAVGGAALVGGVMSSKAAGDAADAQTAAANASNETQRYMYDTTRQDNAPFLQNGTAGNNRLAYLLGVRQTPTMTSPDIVNQIRSAFPHWGGSDAYSDDDLLSNFKQYAPGLLSGVDRSGEALSAGQMTSLKNILDNLKNVSDQPQQVAENDPAYGSLLRRFSMDDLKNDPVYQTGLQFGLDEGNKGIERQAAASGSMLSGATLKALSKYATDYAGTKAGEAYNRYNNDQTNTYNRLAGISGTGQQANALVGSAGQNYANNVSANQIGVGNARAASAIGSANAWSNAIGQGYNMYQGNRLMNGLLSGGGSGGGAVTYDPNGMGINNTGNAPWTQTGGGYGGSGGGV